MKTNKFCPRVYPDGGFYSQGYREKTDTGATSAEIHVPFVKEMCEAAVTIHRHFPSMRVLGFDVIVGPSGPVFLETNTRHHNKGIQLARDKGLRDPEFDPRLGFIRDTKLPLLPLKLIKNR